jgi:hypothetical protein
MPIRSRPPTGKTPWPFIVIAGEEKSGKGINIAMLSRSKKVGPMYWLDLGEGSADEYSIIPGTSWEVLVHDGTQASIKEQVRAVHAEAARIADAGEPPLVLSVDSMGAYWRRTPTPRSTSPRTTGTTRTRGTGRSSTCSCPCEAS